MSRPSVGGSRLQGRTGRASPLHRSLWAAPLPLRKGGRARFRGSEVRRWEAGSIVKKLLSFPRRGRSLWRKVVPSSPTNSLQPRPKPFVITHTPPQSVLSPPACQPPPAAESSPARRKPRHPTARLAPVPPPQRGGEPVEPAPKPSTKSFPPSQKGGIADGGDRRNCGATPAYAPGPRPSLSSLLF